MSAATVFVDAKIINKERFEILHARGKWTLPELTENVTDNSIVFIAGNEHWRFFIIKYIFQLILSVFCASGNKYVRSDFCVQLKYLA